MRRDDPKGRVTVPNHKEIKRSTLKNVLRQAELSIDELMALLNS